MTINLQTQRVTEPTVFVTKGRQRVKQYDGNIVYLKNGNEFEIELFNPTSNKVLAKINLNGKSLGSGIVLRPGERVFLERYLDEAKKFIFETYEIDAKDPNVQKAIKNNGEVEVEFYDEYKQPYIVYNYHYYYDPYWYQPYTPTRHPITPTYLYNNTTGSVKFDNTVTTQDNSKHSLSWTSGVYNTNNSFTCSCNAVNTPSYKEVPEFKETGRVEKGSYSDQSFMYDNTSFNYYCNWRCIWKILPESQKAFMKEDLKVFCPNCRSKRRKETHKFCPSCGTKF